MDVKSHTKYNTLHLFIPFIIPTVVVNVSTNISPLEPEQTTAATAQIDDKYVPWVVMGMACLLLLILVLLLTIREYHDML